MGFDLKRIKPNKQMWLLTSKGDQEKGQLVSNHECGLPKQQTKRKNFTDIKTNGNYQLRQNSFTRTNRRYSMEEEIATHSSILSWEIPWTEKPGGL